MNLGKKAGKLQPKEKVSQDTIIKLGLLVSSTFSGHFVHLRIPTEAPRRFPPARGGPAFIRFSLYFLSQCGICLSAVISANLRPQYSQGTLVSVSSLASKEGLKLDPPAPFDADPPPEPATGPTACLNYKLCSFHLGILPAPAPPPPAAADYYLLDDLLGILGL